MMSNHRRNEEIDKVTGVRLLLAELLILSKVANQSKHRYYCTFLLVVVNRLFINLLIECIKKLESNVPLIENQLPRDAWSNNATWYCNNGGNAEKEVGGGC